MQMKDMLDQNALKQYLADSPPTVVPLSIKPHFDALSSAVKLYAHHISMLVQHQISISFIFFFPFISARIRQCFDILSLKP